MNICQQITQEYFWENIIIKADTKGDARKIMIDEMKVIDLDDYGDNKSSRYINYLKEMAIYNEENQ